MAKGARHMIQGPHVSTATFVAASPGQRPVLMLSIGALVPLATASRLGTTGEWLESLLPVSLQQ